MVLLAALVGLYAAVVLLLWWQQDGLVFPGAGYGSRPVDAYGVRTFTLTRPGGQRFRVAEAGPARPSAVLLYFVGNGEDLYSAARSAAALAAHDVRVLSPEYPGYGASEGRPGVESIAEVADAAAAHAQALAVELSVPLLVGGSSLGTFSAVRLAAAGIGQRCLLRAPPRSLVAAAAERFWWLPVGLLLRHRFDNETVVPGVRCPLLIVHGDADSIVPLAHGRELAARSGGPTELLVVPGAGHNDLSLAPDGPVGARVGAFLRGS
jgi:pimeloyl-ACP methyl ester carboxylesterase